MTDYEEAYHGMTARYDDVVQALSILRQLDDLDDPERSPDTMWAEVLKAIAIGLRAENCSIMLLDQNAGVLVLRAAFGPLDSEQPFKAFTSREGPRFPLGEGIVGKVALTGEPACIADVSVCPDFISTPPPLVPVRSLLCFPLRTGNHDIGVINLSHSKPGFFPDESLRSMYFIAERAARLFGNRLLHDQLMRSEQHYRLVADNAMDGIAFFLADGRLRSANPALELISGLYGDKLFAPGPVWASRVMLEDREAFDAHHTLVMEKGCASIIEYRFLDADGALHDLEQRSSPMLDEEGQIVGNVAIIRDITERKRKDLDLHRYQNHLAELVAERTAALSGANAALEKEVAEHAEAENALRESEQRHSALLDSLPVGVFLVDPQSRVIVDANPAALSMLGMTLNETVGLNCSEVFTGCAAPDCPLTRKHALTTSTECMLLPAGDEASPLPIAKNALTVMLGGSTFILESFMDMSRQKLVEAELARLAEVVNQAAVSITITDLNGDIEYVNPYFEKATGYTAAEALGRNPRFLKTSLQGPQVYKEMWTAITHGDIWKGTLANRRKNGELIFEECTIFPIKDSSGLPVSYASVKKDISALKAAESALKESEGRLQRIFDLLPVFVFAKDAQGKFLFVNKAVTQAFGMADGQLTGMYLTDFKGTDPAAVAQIQRDDHIVLETRQPMFIPEERLVDANGRERIVQVSKVPYYDAVNATEAVLSTAVDITEQRAAVTTLRKREAILQAVSFAAERFLLMGDWSESLAEVLQELGKAADVTRACVFRNHRTLVGDLVTTRIREWLGLDAKPCVCSHEFRSLSYVTSGLNRWMEAMGSREPIYGEATSMRPSEMEYLQRYGVLSIALIPVFSGVDWWGVLGFTEEHREREWAKAEIEALRAAAGTLGAAIERNKAEVRLREGEERLALALRGGELGLWDWNLETGRAFFDERWARMLGYANDEIEQHYASWMRLAHPDDVSRAVERFALHREGKTPFYECEMRMRSRSGEWRWILSRGRVVARDAYGKPIRATGTHLDITTRKQAEEAISQARAQEVAISARIQQTLLLGVPPKDLPRLDITAFTIPSQHVDGDFYEFFRHDDDTVDLVIGDVMGKGIPAALTSAAIKTHLMRAMVELREPGQNELPAPALIVGWLQAQMAPQLIHLETFATLCYARIELRRRTMTFVDCGHTQTVHHRCSTGEIILLQGHNMPLGFAEEDHIIAKEIPIAEGDLLVFYSDGLTDAWDASGAPFGMDRLIALVHENRDKGAGDVLNSISSAVTTHALHARGADDISCATVRIGSAMAIRKSMARREFPASLASLTSARSFLEVFCREANAPMLDGDMQSALALAMNEALANIIKHAYAEDSGKPIVIEFCCYPVIFEIRLIHWGAPFEHGHATRPPSFDGSRDNGFGVYIMDALMDAVEYMEGPDEEHIIRMVKHLAPNPAATPRV